MLLVLGAASAQAQGFDEPEVCRETSSHPPAVPIFLSAFESTGMCEWGNVAAACVDGNVCTDDDCDATTGACSHPFNSAPCTLPHAGGSCSTGSCVFDACDAGFSSCDGNPANGCEVDHAAYANTCETASELGSFGGDTACGFACDLPPWTTWATDTGLTSRWFHARLEENSACPAAIEHKVRLKVPTGFDFDLYVYTACGNLYGLSNKPPGGNEEVVVRADDNPSGDDSFDYWIEVRYVSGAVCRNWVLHIDGHAC